MTACTALDITFAGRNSGAEVLVLAVWLTPQHKWPPSRVLGTCVEMSATIHATSKRSTGKVVAILLGNMPGLLCNMPAAPHHAPSRLQVHHAGSMTNDIALTSIQQMLGMAKMPTSGMREDPLLADPFQRTAPCSSSGCAMQTAQAEQLLTYSRDQQLQCEQERALEGTPCHAGRSLPVQLWPTRDQLCLP